MAGEQSEITSGVSVDTAKDFSGNIPVSEHMSELREQVRQRFETVFKALPEADRGPFRMREYMEKNPQSIIFIPEKELNMFPFIVEEAKVFAKDIRAKSGTEKTLDQIREHEFEHVQKAYELGMDIRGIGFVMMKHEGKPVFGGFLLPPDDQEISLRDKLRVKLAPKTMAFRSADDILSSELLITESLAKAKNWEDFDQTINDFLFVVGERYLPKNVHNFLQDIITVK